jgi:Fic family protein
LQPSDFTSDAPGRAVKTDGDYYAFVPNPLPPSIQPDWSLARLVSEAERALSELSGICRHLPNPQILMSSSVRREAVLSSRIENTQTDMEDLFAYEVDETVQRAPDVKEVANYVKALELGLKRLDDLPICGRLIRELHATLMEEVHGGHVLPGEFRTTQNWIGPPGCTLNDATFVPPPANELSSVLSDFEQYVNDDRVKEPTLVKCAYLHYQFETIHPFADGNGRVGRLLITLFLCSSGVLSEPLLYLSEFFEHRRNDYYRLLLGASQRGEWREWLEFFLRGVRVQSEIASEQANQLIQLNQSYRDRLGTKRVPEAALRLVDHIFVNPLVMPSKLVKVWKMPFPTVMKGVDRLVSLGILTESTNKLRNRVYRASEVVNMIKRGT